MVLLLISMALFSVAKLYGCIALGVTAVVAIVLSVIAKNLKIKEELAEKNKELAESEDQKLPNVKIYK